MCLCFMSKCTSIGICQGLGGLCYQAEQTTTWGHNISLLGPSHVWRKDVLSHAQGPGEESDPCGWPAWWGWPVPWTMCNLLAAWGLGLPLSSATPGPPAVTAITLPGCWGCSAQVKALWVGQRCLSSPSTPCPPTLLWPLWSPDPSPYFRRRTLVFPPGPWGFRGNDHFSHGSHRAGILSRMGWQACS